MVRVTEVDHIGWAIGQDGVCIFKALKTWIKKCRYFCSYLYPKNRKSFYSQLRAIFKGTPKQGIPKSTL